MRLYRLLEKLTLTATEASRFSSDMGQITYHQIIAAVTVGLTEGEETELYKKVRGYLYTHPEDCQKFETYLINEDGDGIWMRLAGMAMGRLGHTQAQSSLRNVIAERQKEGRDVAPFIHLLSQSREPKVETLDLLQNFANSPQQDMKEAGMLATGTALSGHRIQDPDDATKRINYFKLKLRDSKDEREQSLILDLFGNSEMPEILDTVETLLRSNQHDRNRTLAIESLRMVNDPRARELLVQLLGSTSMPDRISATQALKLQPFMPQVLEAATASIIPSSNADQALLRRSFLEWLFIHHNQIADLNDKLRDSLKTESNEDNRRLILSYLDIAAK